MTERIFIAVGVVVVCLLLGWLIYFCGKKNAGNSRKDTPPEIDKDNVDTLVAYIKAQKDHDEQQQRLKDLKKAEMKQKLEVFKQTKDQLKDRLRSQMDAKQWRPLDSVLRSADKGDVGIYVLHNRTKNKYYVGQAKQLVKRVKNHFEVEDIARDYLAGDTIEVKFLTANELGADYRLDHIERTGIEIFDSEKSGYNKTKGNL